MIGERSHSLHPDPGDLAPPRFFQWPGSPRAGPQGHYPCHSVRRGSPRPCRAWRSTRNAGWLRAGWPRSGHPGSSASRCLWCCLWGEAGWLIWQAHTCTLTRGDPGFPWAGVWVPAAPWGLSPRHTVPEGPRRLPGAHSQA